MIDGWDDLEGVDDWSELPVDEDPPRRDPVRRSFLGTGLWAISVRRDEFE
jgi:hypothetical protein